MADGQAAALVVAMESGKVFRPGRWFIIALFTRYRVHSHKTERDIMGVP